MLPRINKLPRNFIPLSPPYITTEEEKVVSKVLRSGILGLGPYIELFEKEVARFVGTKYAVATSSGTAGLHLALVTQEIKSGDEVITSPFSFVASANAILYVGAKPIFADIDSKTLNIDATKIEAAITKKTRAILPVHIFGYPIDYNKILKIAKKHKLKIIEDACESLGAKYKGKMVGSFGNLSVFAFYPNKQITTGEGGMIVTNDQKQYLLLKSLVNQGRSDSGQWLVHDKLGFNYRMDEMSAALGYVQMKKIKFILNSRKKVANFYKKYLNGIKEVRLIADDDRIYKRSWQTFVVILTDDINRNKVIERLGVYKIQSKPYLPSIHLQPFFRKKFNFREKMFPVSESISKSSLALPLFTDMSEKMVETVSSRLADAISWSRD